MIGYEKWKEKQSSTNISELFTVSNEVFLFFTIENNLEQWNPKQIKSVSARQKMILVKNIELTLIDIGR